MIIIDKDDLEKYRFAVAKVVFLKTYSDYIFVKNNPDDNSMVVVDPITKEEEILYFFRKPKNKPIGEKYLIAYEKYVRNSSDNNEKNSFVLSDSFEDRYKIEIYQALVSSSSYFFQLADNYKKFFEKYIIDMISVHDTTGNLCKYYASTIAADGNDYGIKNGKVSFANPQTFNDPFDCNCAFNTGANMSNYFRILCLTPENKNILMWSYYGKNHKGYCFEYSKHSIIDSISNLKINGLCLIGKVDYKDKRPKTNSATNKLSYTELEFYVNAAFTKYEKWKHENEYRFVLLSEDLVKEPNYITVDATIQKIYIGCECADTTELDSISKAIPVTKLQKDDTQYLLI